MRFKEILNDCGARTVYDRKTGLEWCPGPCSIDWYEARAWCDAVFVNGGGWRMPASNELISLPQKREIDGIVCYELPDIFTSETETDRYTEYWDLGYIWTGVLPFVSTGFFRRDRFFGEVLSIIDCHIHRFTIDCDYDTAAFAVRPNRALEEVA